MSVPPAGRTLLGLVTMALLGCFGGAQEETEPPSPVLDPVAVPESSEAAEPMCERTEGPLPANATLPRASASYTLTMVRGDAASRPAWVAGTLSLEPRPSGLRRLEDWETPLQGTADIDVQRVGAYRVGSLTSDDPAAPGVLVLRGPASDPQILLRLGSSSNRTDRVAFDQAFTVLTVRHIGADGFAGSWRSGSSGDSVSGYFCAEQASS